MRTETEIMDLILNFAKNDENVLAVLMNGSRVNVCATKDNFQDYDVVFVVNEVTSFIEDKSWIQNFGEIVISQEPNKNDMANGLKIDNSKSGTQACSMILKLIQVNLENISKNIFLKIFINGIPFLQHVTCSEL